MRATANDVARLARVSVSTVSRALSSPHLVAPATLQKVQQAADQLGYLPNRAARGLVTGRTGNLALIIPDLNNPYFAGLTKETQEQARARGLQIDRKSTRLNSSHVSISYAVFCLKKK